MRTKCSSRQIILHVGISLVLCLALAMVCRKIFSYKRTNELMALDQLRPLTFKYLYPDTDLRYLKLYEVYFRRMYGFFHGSFPEIDGLLGYCAYQRGNKEEAARWYAKALALDPDFFWYYYNLGLIDLQLGRYDQSLALFKKAFKLDVRDTFAAIAESKRIYMPIVYDYVPSPAQGLSEQLEDGRQIMGHMAILARMQKENPGVPYEGNWPALMCY